MCSKHLQKRKFWLRPFFLYTVMIILGILSGYSDNAGLHAFAGFIADIFIKIFKCISLPIIGLSIIVTLSHYDPENGMKRLWRRAMTYTFSTTFIAAAVSCLLYIVIHPGMTDVVKNSIPSTKTQSLSYLQHISNIIPSSVFSPFLEQQVMAVLLLGIVVGIAIRFIPDKESHDTVRSFFRGLHGLFMVITGWVIAIIPLGLFGFVSTSVLQLRGGMSIKGIGAYLLIIVLANLVQGFVILPLWLKSQGIKPFWAMRRMLPALSLAFFSKSSVGTLPVTMETAEKNLGVDPKVSRFVLPLCTSLNMNGCAAFIFVTVIFLMQNNGITLTLPMMGLWILIATIAAIGNAGVPMGCFFLSASLLASMNVSITLLGIILPFYSLIDMLETSLNVWSDACVAKVVDEKLQADARELGGLEQSGQTIPRTRPSTSVSVYD